jgi:hypothetical protein
VLVKQGCPYTANSKSLVWKVYIAGEEYQTSKIEIVQKWHLYIS